MPKRTADTQLTKEIPDQPDQSDLLAAHWWTWTPERRQEELHRLHTALSVPGGSLDDRREWQRLFDAYRQMEETPPTAVKATAAQMASRK